MVTRPSATSFFLQMTSSFIKADHSRWLQNARYFVSRLSRAHSPNNRRAIWSNFVKMEGFATSFCNFWQISSDKICTNWVAKFLIKGGGGNFIQIGVSCSRGPSMTIAGLGNKDYYHPSNVKFKITHLHFTQCPLSPPDCLILARDTGHLFSFGNKFLGNTSPSTATL